MKEVERVLSGGVVERRMYDDEGKLTDIRKEYPPQHFPRTHQVRRSPGASGGHEH